MITSRRLILAAAIAIPCLFATAADDAKESGVSIFNGTDLTGWKAPEPNPFWKAADGVLIGENNPEKKGSMLYTTESYGDFELEAECRWEGEIDSGFMIRKQVNCMIKIAGIRSITFITG